MYPAFGLVVAGPASGPGVFARGDLARAGRASDRRIALCDQRVARQGMRDLIGLDILVGPGRQRVDLDEIVLVVPGDDRRAGPGRCLDPAHARDPGGPAVQGPGERVNLAQEAAEVRIAVVQLLAVLGVLLG